NWGLRRCPETLAAAAISSGQSCVSESEARQFAAPRARRWGSRLAGKYITARKGAPMSTEENKAIARRLIDEVWTKGRLEVIDELIADDFVTTVVGAPEQIRGPQGFREFVAIYRTAFPDLRISVDEQIAEG